MCKTFDVDHMQHAVCQVVQGVSSVITFDRAKTHAILGVVCWLKPSVDEGIEETRVPGKKI